jgi:hypothetical protein
MPPANPPRRAVGGDAGPAHVMILGCGRSGTSIFGELFEGLADYRYLSEPAFEDLLATGFTQPTACKVPRESDAYPAPPGLSFPLETYLGEASGAKIFWIVRHPLDAVCSLRIGIERDWGHHPRPPDWRDWLDRPLLARCAHHWAFLNTAGFDQVCDRAHVVRFEEMIAEPLAFAQSICSIVGVSAAACADHLARWAERVQDTNNAAFVEAVTSRGYSRPDHARRVGRWQENLSLAEASALWPIVEPAATRFGYALEADA